MSSHFAKPENALRKAKELVRINKSSSALKTLHQILTSKRHRIWQLTHEKIMYFYLELSVALRRPVKDALVQYRIICQSANSTSMDKVCRYYKELAESRATEAEAEAKAAGITVAAEAAVAGEEDDDTSILLSTVDDDDDIDNNSSIVTESPESLLIAAMSGEGAKERKDRLILMPWVKYLWECYRSLLDVLRNNNRFSLLYHQTARSALEFTGHYHRNAEFRKLAEIMRNHLITIGRYQQYGNQHNSIDLNSPEVQTAYLETRFLQLKIAAELELWQEAYRTIEDIYENMRQSHSEPKIELMALYYEKLSAIFWASNNYLFHAYSINKFYCLTVEMQISKLDRGESINEQEIAIRKQLASAVVVSSLIVPGSITDSMDDNDSNLLAATRPEGATRLAQLLGFKRELPNRQRLLNLIQSQGVLDECSIEIKSIYSLIEESFGPLSLWNSLKPLLDNITINNSDSTNKSINLFPLNNYIEPLHHLVIIRVLQQLSTVFQSIKLNNFCNLIPQSVANNPNRVERLIMQNILNEQLQLRIDHRQQLIIFPEISLEAPRMREQLTVLTKQLTNIAAQIEPRPTAERLAEREQVFKLVAAGMDTEHSAVFKRLSEIESRKQESERQTVERERREAESKQSAVNQRKQEELKRLTEESKKRESDRLKAESDQRELASKQQLANEIAKKVEIVTSRSKVTKGLANKAQKTIAALTAGDLQSLDKVALLAAQDAVLEQERKEIERRRRETARRIDYLTRAARIEERELLIQAAETQKESEKEQFEADFKRYVEQDRLLHERALKEKERLIRMSEQRGLFQEKLLARRQEKFEEEKLKQLERLKKRTAEFEREERRRKAAEEELDRQRKAAAAAEEARLESERAKQRAVEEEKRKMAEVRAERDRLLQESIRKQTEREEELDRKERERKAALLGTAPPTTTAATGAADRTTWGRSSDRPRTTAGTGAGPSDRPRDREDRPRDGDRPRDREDRPRDRDDRPIVRAGDRDTPSRPIRSEEQQPGSNAWRRDGDRESNRDREPQSQSQDQRSERPDRLRFSGASAGSSTDRPDRDNRDRPSASGNDQQQGGGGGGGGAWRPPHQRDQSQRDQQPRRDDRDRERERDQQPQQRDPRDRDQQRERPSTGFQRGDRDRDQQQQPRRDERERDLGDLRRRPESAAAASGSSQSQSQSQQQQPQSRVDNWRPRNAGNEQQQQQQDQPRAQNQSQSQSQSSDNDNNINTDKPASESIPDDGFQTVNRVAKQRR